MRYRIFRIILKGTYLHATEANSRSGLAPGCLQSPASRNAQKTISIRTLRGMMLSQIRTATGCARSLCKPYFVSFAVVHFLQNMTKCLINRLLVLSPLNSIGNYTYHLHYQSVTVHFVLWIWYDSQCKQVNRDYSFKQH
jgi:hypothetical protein